MSGKLRVGILYAVWIALLITIATTVLMIALYLTGHAKLPEPDLQEWLQGDQPGLAAAHGGFE